MQPDQQVDPQLQMEIIRRRAELGANSAGIPGGAETTNNPQSGMPVDTMTNPPQVSGGAEGFPSGGATQAVKEQKGESQTLVNALIFRLKKLTERGE